MNNVQKRKLRSRLMIAIISMLSCIAIMGVGVFAATDNFSVTVDNRISIHFAKVDGKIWAKRYGNVIYGTESADVGVSAVTLGQTNADSNGYLLIYDHLRTGEADYVSLVELNLKEIETQVNFLTRDNDTNDDGTEDITTGKLKINYVFKYEFNVSSPADVTVAITDASTRFDSKDPRNNKVKLTYKYLYSAQDPTDEMWQNAAQWNYTSSTGQSGEEIHTYSTTLTSNSVVVSRPETYTIYVLAQLEVAETNTLSDAFALGVYDDYTWKFDVNYTPNLEQA